MLRKHLVVLASLLGIASPLVSQQTPSAASGGSPDGSLVYAVYVSRHGVRSPTSKAGQNDRFSAAPWPSWSVEPGYLTPHGFELMRLFGTYDRTDLAAQGLFSSEGCADAKKVTFHADSDQRTRETAKALVEGMFPGCGVDVQGLEEGKNDPLFHVPTGTISAEQAVRGAAAIEGRVGNNPASIATAYHGLLSSLDDVLKNCGAKSENHTRASIFDVPASIGPGSEDHVAEMRGPLSTAATLSENLLLEYTDGMDAKDVGWGCVDGAKLRDLINLHTASFDLAQRTQAVASVQAALLLHTIESSLQQAATGKAIAGAEGKPGDKVLFLVGHDTNLANIAGVLGLEWLADGRRNDTPPGSALVFELWKLSGNKGYAVKVSFTAQTLEQMRQAVPLVGNEKPVKVPVFVPVCSHTDGACTLAGFGAAIKGAEFSSKN